MTYAPPPRHRYPDCLITPYHDTSLGLGIEARAAPVSGTWSATARAYFYPIAPVEPFTVAKAYWCNGATVGTDSIDIGVYRMTDLTTGRMDLIRSTGAVLSAGTVSRVQETATWKVARANITSGNSSSDATSYDTASVTLKTGRLYIMSVVNTKASADVVSAITGGPTFTSRRTTQFSGTAYRVSLWTAVPTVDYTGVLTIDFGGGNTQTACVWALEEFSGVDTTTDDGIVQTATGTGTSVTPLATLAAFGSASNATFGINANVSDTTTTPGTGFTEIVDISSATPVACLQTQWRVDNDTTSDGTITSAAWGAIAAEVMADASPFIIPPDMPGTADLYMAMTVSGGTATFLRAGPAGFLAGMRELASMFPLSSSCVPGALSAVRLPLGGFSSRTLIG